MELRFYYDVVCPYAYFASTRVAALARRCDARLQWRPILLGGLFRHVDAPQRPGAEMSAARARHNALDMRRWAALWGVPLQLPTAHPRRTVSAMRLLCAAPDELRPALTRALFEAYWVEGLDLAARDVLDELARAHGLDPACVDSPEARAGLFASTAEAHQAGAFGVPSFVVAEPGAREGRLFWGQDRMHLVEHALRPGGRARQLDDVDPSGWEAPSGARVRVFHDFASPFSYLASVAIEALARRRGAAIEWAPILLGGLFRAIGTPDVPMHVMSAAKQAYVRRDMHDWAALRGVPFRFPSHFPLRTILPLRVALAEPAVTPHLYRAAWAEDRPIDQPEVLADVLAAHGFDARELLARAQTPAIKQALRANTEAAQAAGACGVPSIEVHADGRAPLMFWGQDRLELVDAALAGFPGF